MQLVQKRSSRLAVCGATLALSLLAGCGFDMNLPPGFLRQRSEESGDLRALTATGSRLWVREFAVESGATDQFWADAVVFDLKHGRGYELDAGEPIVDGQGNTGFAFTGATTADGVPCGYFVAVLRLPRPFPSWFTSERVRVVEFAAPVDEFKASVASVRAAVASLR